MRSAETGKSKFEIGKSIRDGLPSLVRRGLRGGPLCLALLFAAIMLAAQVASAQVTTGTPPFGSFSGGPEVVDNGTNNVHWSFPVLSKSGRGIPFHYLLTYDSSVWSPRNASGQSVWTPVPNWGWATVTNGATGYVTYNVENTRCPYGGPPFNWYYWNIYAGFAFVDPGGTTHPFSSTLAVSTWTSGAPCGGGPPANASGVTTDDSGFYLTATAGSSAPSGTLVALTGWTLKNPRLPLVVGAVVPTTVTINAPWFPVGQTPTPSSASMVDTNSNTISTNGTTYVDTLGTTVLTIAGSGTPSSPMKYTYTTQSGSATVQVNYQAYTVQTNFGCSGTTDYGATSQNLVSSIALPDGTSYSFTYETTPGHSPNVTGRPAKVTLPTGGYITYSYSSGSNGITCTDGSTATLTRTVYDNEGNSAAWSYAHTENGSAWTTTLTDPQSNQTTFNFQAVGLGNGVYAYETERQVAGLKTVYTCYNGATYNCNTTAISLLITRRTVWTALGSQTSEVDTDYDNVGYGLPTEVDEYDWGATAPTRKTITTYNYNTSCGVTNYNVVDRPCSVTIKDSSGATKSSTSYTYDSNGNMLSETPSVGPALTLTYNSNGTLATSADPSGKTSYSYGSNSCNAFADTVTPPISSLTATAVWSCNPAVMTSSKDANSQTTTFAYNDPFNRLTNTTYPDGGSITIAYPSATQPTTTTTTTKITSAVSRTDTTNLDGLGRVISQTVAGVTTNTAYDSLGRVSTVSIANSGAQDTYSYDALNRVTKVVHADSSNAQTSYTNNCATFQDEAQKAHTLCNDGLGRLSSVTEDPSGLGYQTTYGYDAPNDLTGVTQGNQTRSFQYDALGRLTQSSTPEAGTVNYTYDSDSTCGTSSVGDLVKRVDARGIRTCYAYDAVHRLTQKSYSDGTATANYSYDQSSYNGLTISNGKGRRTGMSDGSGQTAWSYDPMGRALTEEKTIAGINKTIGYSYNYDGSLASLTYPSGRTITYMVDSLGRPQSAQDTANGINYAASASYAPQGVLASLLNGQTSSFGGITYSIGYNNRLWPSSISASFSNGTALSLAYSYYYNGNVNVETNNRSGMSGRSVTYGYDSLNRWNSATSTATSGSYCWGQAVPPWSGDPNSYGYDRYGNLTIIDGTQSGTGCSQPILSVSASPSTNQITSSGFSYDAAGDVTNDGAYTYAWDAEGRLTSAGGVTYTYDGDGQRVEKSSGTLYWQGVGGSVLAETDTSGNTLNEYIFFAGARVARRDGSGNIFYYFQDRLGTNRTIVYGSGSNPGALCYDADFYPFGGELAFTNNCGQNYKFAGMERDPETGNDHTLFRSYRSNYGRWLSPDPADLAAADPTNPQSWNRYAYALNNPVNLTDPRGLDDCSDEDGGSDGCPTPDETSGPPDPIPGSAAAYWAKRLLASYNPGLSGPVILPFQAQSWGLQSVNKFLQDYSGEGFLWKACAPFGGLSNTCNPGQYPNGAATDLGFTYVVNRLECDNGGGTNCPSWPSVTEFNLAALEALAEWQTFASLPLPAPLWASTTCGPLMAAFGNTLQTWARSHPGQAPGWMSKPPNLGGSCGPTAPPPS
jgi:RHS repeat-associated protein